MSHDCHSSRKLSGSGIFLKEEGFWTDPRRRFVG